VADFSANISAFYSAKTSLATIIPQEDVGSSLSRTQVNAYIHLNGELMQYPDISFSFELPNSSSEINTLFYNAIDTTNKDNLSKQFFYFVFSNQFLPNDAGTGSISPGLESSGIGLLTSMVNNFISQQFKYGDLGIVFKEANQSNAAEYGINANVPFLNDRIVFETSLGYYDNRNSSQGSQGIRDFYGDFSLEYLITPQGNWKIKVYNFSDQYSTENIETVYGVGLALVYKQEFNNRKDFIETFRRKDKKKKKKSPDPNHHNQVIKNE
ncbi:MAG: translocation/assembly module TamB domain-containing protein, partial [Bacteroidales bacterium]